jgi:hypothetical protein
MYQLSYKDRDFITQAAIAAMQAMIQARAITEAAQARNLSDSRLQDAQQGTQRDGPEQDGELFTHSIYNGVHAEIELHKDGDGKYAWGELLAEEAFEIALFMWQEKSIKGI